MHHDTDLINIIAVGLALALVSLGLALNLALVPLHRWLIPAHAGAPGTVSPLLSALVIKASLFVLLRCWVGRAAPGRAPSLDPSPDAPADAAADALPPGPEAQPASARPAPAAARPSRPRREMVMGFSSSSLRFSLIHSH